MLSMRDLLRVELSEQGDEIKPFRVALPKARRDCAKPYNVAPG